MIFGLEGFVSLGIRPGFPLPADFWSLLAAMLVSKGKARLCRHPSEGMHVSRLSVRSIFIKAGRMVLGKKIGEKIPESKKRTANLTPEVVPRNAWHS